MKFDANIASLLMISQCSRLVSAFSSPRIRSPLAAAASSTLIRMTSSTSGSTMVSTNPMLEQSGLPKFESVEPKHLTPAVEELLAKLEKEFAGLEDDLLKMDGGVDYDEVLPVVERIQYPLGYVWGLASHLNGVKNGEELRNAYEANQGKVVESMTKFSQSKPLFDALSAIKKQWAEDGEACDSFLMKQKRRAVENSLLGMTLGGVGLEGAEKERFNEIKLKLATLSNKFSNNVLDDTKNFSYTIEDPAVLEGVPESAKAMWANSHVQYMKSQAKEGEEQPKVDMSAATEAGPWRITLDIPSYIPVMSHLPDRGIREKVYKAYVQKASEKSEEKNNVPLIYEILSLKQEMAELLGFANYAELSLAKKMASTVEEVTALSNLIADKAVPAAKKELEEVTALARKEGGDEYSVDNLEKLEPWDVTFWSERLKESKFDMTQEELRPYFALPSVLDGMFGLLKRLFDVDVKAADGEAEVWNEDVRFFKIFDAKTDKHVASFFLDPYSRPENKRGGAWMADCVGKSEATNNDIPVAYLTCNGSPPVGDKPSLMTFQEVETLFHETGHGLQHMLTEAQVGDVAGINGIEWDAVELPSQFMENWCYDRPTVFGFAKHWETGEPLPEDKFEKLCAQKIFNSGMQTCRQLYFGQLDLNLHSNFDATAGEKEEGKGIFDLQREIASIYTPHSMPLEEDRFLCSFSHIFAGGYAAGYYSYKWAEVMSADAFGAFEDVGLDNEEGVRNVGKKFRETVLSLGGGIPPSDVFKEFRGREPTPDAYMRHNGLD
mmetsp:Transcript_21787/g.51694  ORF Transcript_21787/g.51694 Transcript_21787/m.51694 type:complete len:778 (+) Transcript_21787:138-2471(+)